MVDELVFVIIIACSTTFTNGVDQSLTIITSTGGARARWNLWMMVGHGVPITGHHIIGLRKSSLIIILGQQQCTYLPLP